MSNTGKTPLPFQYVGGKGEWIDWYLHRTPGHRFSVEVCAGTGAWTICKPSVEVETINDLDQRITDIFRGIRDHRDALCEALAATPYSRLEWLSSLKDCNALDAGCTHIGALERARTALVLLRQSFANSPGRAWSRVITHSRKDMASSCSRWVSLPDDIASVADRLKSVQIDSLPADECIQKYDRKGTCMFVDPPYLLEVRAKGLYRVEMTRDQHKALIKAMLRARSSFMVCGYPSPLYDSNLTEARGWTRHEREVHARTNVKTDGTVSDRPTRTEVLWVRKERK